LTSYSKFSIQEVIPDLSQKRIIVKTNFKVDPNSVTESTVALYNYDKSTLEIYQLKIDNKEIHIMLNDFPADNSRYYLKVANIKDALGRVLNTSFDDYIRFESEIKTKIQIVSPISRETLKSRIVNIKIKANETVEEDITCKIEISSDNVFYNKLVELQQPMTGDELNIEANVEREGQIYIRARLEKSSTVVGDWSELICFNIYTIQMDSLQTTFLEDYLTTEDLFDDSIDMIETVVSPKEVFNIDEGALYFELNKQIKVPDEYELDENGYINLGTVIGFRKELK
jgi:hypothetical protein